MKILFKKHSSLLGTKLLLTSLFLVIYAAVSVTLLMSPRTRGEGYHENDQYFQADSEFFAKRVAKDRHTYDRVRYHPMFVLFFNPVGRSMNVITRNPEVSACLLNAIAGSVGIYLALTLFYNVLGFPASRSILYTAILGLSSTHVIFSTVPDTFIFTSVGLIALIIIAYRYRSLIAWVGISVYLIGVTISNAVLAFLAAYFFLFRRKYRLHLNRRLFYRYFIGVLSVSAILSILQKLIYDVWLLTEWNKIQKEDIGWYLYLPTNWADNWDRLGLLTKHIALFSVVPPQLKTTIHFLNPTITMATFMNTAWWDFPPASWLALVLWVAFLSVAGFYLVRKRMYRHPLIALCLLGLAFNMVFHYFYGDDFMLFSCDWLIFLLLLVFFTIEYSPLPHRYASLYQASLLLFTGSLLLASGNLVYDLYHILLIQ